jgi:uncharacterized protein YndB with AHSA1/START domain
VIEEFARSLTGSASAPVLNVTRHYDATADEVWSALTEPDRLRRWLGEVSGDPAGGFEITFADAPDSPARADVDECAPPRSLVVRWSWGRERASRVSVALQPQDDGTLLTLEHRLGEPDHVADYGGGWEQSFATLARKLGAPASGAVDESAVVARWDAMRRRAVELTVDLAAAPAEVWRAFATPDGLRSWWWTHWSDVTITADARPGGAYRIEAPAAGIVLSGTYLAVDEPGHLSFTWRWTDAEGTSVDEACDILIEPAASGSRLTVRHTGPWADDIPAENYRQGWEFTLGQLRRVLES